MYSYACVFVLYLYVCASRQSVIATGCLISTVASPWSGADPEGHVTPFPSHFSTKNRNTLIEQSLIEIEQSSTLTECMLMPNTILQLIKFCL